MTARGDAVFAALADPTRRGLLREVVDRGPCSATDLAARRPISRQAVMKHLAVLDDAGLVHRERAGRAVRYVADTAPLDEVTEWIATTGAGWDRRLGALRSVLDEAHHP